MAETLDTTPANCSFCQQGRCHSNCPSDEECFCEPLYESGIHWIDEAYRLVRELRQKYGQHPIRPLVKRGRFTAGEPGRTPQ